MRIIWDVTPSCTTWHHGDSVESRVARPSSGRGVIRPRATALRTFHNVPPDGPACAPHESAPGVVMDISLRNISMHYIRIHFGYAPGTHILNAL